ncbi:GPI-anchored protein LORELEI [Solanum tuberosum]|uniref:GPI-anchored protein n=2 Tax=Solanum tuberosum TaxID=4113 RepID=M1BMP9_SOLTU|nr:PREDICTED: GPI-anchored protein LORELEI [Solanum tuberosum]
MEWRHYCSCFILLFFFSLLQGALTSTSISDRIFVYPISTGRNLLQAKDACPVSFEFQNYTMITSQCKPPQYPAKQCCDAFLQFACPFVESLNNQSNDCISVMHRYIDQYGHYPTGLFASVCKGTQQGLPCPALAPSQSADRDDTSSSQINRKLSLVYSFATTFMGVLILVLLF